ncbi:uncharacterized protein [Diabrotica undecimpunctata]|uniref:uncharacterized protein n=1 Tax=Diabrotica undecimpunctata TaxID=50387 RepID=UPI003B63F1DD
MKRNKREISKEFLPSRLRSVNLTLYGFTKTKTLISRVPKKNRAVLLISPLHHTKEDDILTGLPEINAFYNNTKSGVDSVDEKCTKYSCCRRSRCWQMAIFVRIIDMSALTAYIIHQACANRTIYTRLEFLILAQQLYEPLLREREINQRLPRELRLLHSKHSKSAKNKSN